MTDMFKTPRPVRWQAGASGAAAPGPSRHFATPASSSATVEPPVVSTADDAQQPMECELAGPFDGFAATGAQAQTPERREALVLGNAAYRDAPLKNPVNDARLLAAKLKELGFDVIARENATLGQIASAVAEFAGRLTPDTAALVYFAGHGVQSRGRNYLIPIDAAPNNETELEFQAVDVGRLTEELDRAQPRISFLILDACRNNPFERRLRGAARGLAAVDAARGALIAYATAPGSVASDGDGANGPYTEELVRAFAIPNLMAEAVFKRVTAAVERRTNGQQTPWTSSSLRGDFVFNLRAGANPTVAGGTGRLARAVQDEKILVGKSTKPECLPLRFGNRHGLVTGATGTGKSVTLQVLAEGFSSAGVPVFATDIKGDLSGIAIAAEATDALVKRASDIGFKYQADEFPVVFWDLFGEQGHPIRTTISAMGPLPVARMLNLNNVQEGVVNIAFRFADDEFGSIDPKSKGLIDLQDLRQLLCHLSNNAKAIGARYGNLATATVASVQRQLLVLENQGGAKLFGEPALSVGDLMRTDRAGRGNINILRADNLMERPRLYSGFLLCLLDDLYEELPEVGDLEKPKLALLFDEAHLLFDDAPRALLDKIERVVRLIRSKGVGVYFVTQNPLDVPDKVRAQLGNRVQHALRAFTPRDQKAVKAAAETLRPNPTLDTAQVITQLGKGEALVSFLEGNGTPSVVQRALICPPSSHIGPLTPAERRAVIANSPIRGKYDRVIERRSDRERMSYCLQEVFGEDKGPTSSTVSDRASWPTSPPPGDGSGGRWRAVLGGIPGGGSSCPREHMPPGRGAKKPVARSIASTIGTQIREALVRGALGILGRR
jgi:DNA helicase HerA-like ATPase